MVAFNTGGLPGIVDDRFTGALAEPFKPTSLASAILWVLKDAERSRAIGVAALVRAETLSAPSRVAGLYSEIYEQAIEHNSIVPLKISMFVLFFVCSSASA